MRIEDQDTLDALDARIKAILPKAYQDKYEEVQPVSMGSAGLKYGMDGKVAWNEIWGSFCDLAMAGGPPHKGMLLEPGSRKDVEARTDRYDEVVEEICRGIWMVTGLTAEPASTPGWIRVPALGEGMAGWLVRAIVMENVAARTENRALFLPAAPGYRLEKEIKNVVTVMAKTCHYWLGHMTRAQQRSIGTLFAKMAAATPLIEPAFSPDGLPLDDDDRRRVAAGLGDAVQQTTGLKTSSHRYTGWLGLECSNVRAAVWMMRALVVSNVLSRREGTALFVPINPSQDPDGEIVATRVAQTHRFAAARGVL